MSAIQRMCAMLGAGWRAIWIAESAHTLLLHRSGLHTHADLSTLPEPMIAAVSDALIDAVRRGVVGEVVVKVYTDASGEYCAVARKVSE